MPESEPTLRKIKLAVGVMTVLLVGMVGTILWKLSQPLTTSLPSPTSSAWQYSLPEGKIESIAQAGPFLAILSATPDGRKIYIFNPATQMVTGTIQATH